MSFLDDAIDDISKNAKEEISFLYDDDTKITRYVSTGSSLLDYIISNRIDGGIPIGRITEVSGLEGTGKSLIAMQICANTVKNGGIAIYVDTEHAFSSEFAERLGLKQGPNFKVIRPTSVEGVFETLMRVIHKLDERKKDKEMKNTFIVFVWDSVAQTPCKADIDTENTDPTSTVGLKPRIISKNIATLLGATGRKNVASVFLNQLRTNIGARPGQDKWITPGGKAIPYAATVCVRLANAGKIKDKDYICGINVLAKCVKTRLGPPYRECTFPLYFTHGVDDLESIIDFLAKEGKIMKTNRGKLGSRFRFKDEPQESELPKLEFKKSIKTDKKVQQKINDILSSVMVVDLFDPDKAEIEIIEDGPIEVI